MGVQEARFHVLQQGGDGVFELVEVGEPLEFEEDGLGCIHWKKIIKNSFQTSVWIAWVGAHVVLALAQLGFELPAVNLDLVDHFAERVHILEVALLESLVY